MNQIDTYTLATVKDASIENAVRELQAYVNDLIAEGYQPIGGVSISHDYNGECAMAQAMGKEASS